MKLYKIENDEQGIWYFTNRNKAAKYIGTTQSYLDYCMILERQCKGWTIEDVSDSIDVIQTKYVDPERKRL